MQKIIKIDTFASVIFSLLLLLTIVTRVADIPFIRVVGKYTLVIFMAWLFVSILSKKFFSKKEFFLFLPLILFNVIYVVNAKTLKDSDALLLILNHAIFFVALYIFSNITWTKFQVKLLSSLFYVSFPILLAISFVATDVLNKNTIGAYSFLLAFFPLLYLIGYSKNLKRTHVLLIYILTAIIVFTSDSRSIIISAFFTLLTFIAWRFITSKKIIFNLYFLSIIGISYWFIVVWPKVYTWKYFYVLDDFSIKLTDKGLLTGRERIWERLVEYITQKPLLGYGSTTVQSDFVASELSAHNMYIQIGLQTGLVGISLLVLFFFFTWKTFWLNKFDRKIALAASFLIGIIVYQIFEVTLTQNLFGLGLLQWIIIGLGLSFSLNKIDKTEST